MPYIHEHNEVMQLVKQLISAWKDWDGNKNFYLKILLPELKKDPEAGTPAERLIFQKLRNTCSPEEWNHLADIVGWVVEQREFPNELERQFNTSVEKGDLRGINYLIFQNNNWIIKYLLNSRLNALKNEAYVDAFRFLNGNDLESAERSIDLVEFLLTDAEREKFEKKKAEIQNQYIESVLVNINQNLDQFNFEEADRLFEEIAEYYPRETYRVISDQARTRKKERDREKYVEYAKNQILDFLKNFEYEKAREIQQQINQEFPDPDYLILEDGFRKNEEKARFKKQLEDFLNQRDFKIADQLAFQNEWISESEYTQLKATYIQKFAESAYDERLNDEQALAICTSGKNKLISARAGSGKTRVLACTTSMLIDLWGTQPDQIMVLAFNRNAAEEISSRIKTKFKQPMFENARTFHSLAHQLVNPAEDILYDDKADVSTKKLSLFVQEIVKQKIKNPAYLLKIYLFFRKEFQEIEKSGGLLKDEEYYDFRRNLRWVTLNAERVKSEGEKFIADFLFEHGITYKYEDACFWNEGIYRPDFKVFVNDTQYIWEHWGIDLDNPERGISKEWGITWSEYREKIDKKREYWKQKKIPLIETSIRDLGQGRENFEKIIKRNLQGMGIPVKPLPEDEIFSKLREKDYLITHLTSIFVSFIQHAKKRKWNSKNIHENLTGYDCIAEKEKIFLELAEEIFLAYEDGLQSAKPNKLIDFDDMMIRAIEKVHQTRGNCRISVGYSKTRTIWMKDLRWILIDEYQDFSQLFFELIEAIRQYNHEVHIVSVGDDWQAINSFAGSDLRYFVKFGHLFHPSKFVNLLTNHRSRERIVQLGNELMFGRGEPSQPHPSKTGGEIKKYFIDDVWLEIREETEFQQAFLEDQRFIIYDPSVTNDKKGGYIRLLASKYIKLCCSILIKEKNPGVKTAILSRTNYIEGVTLARFRHQLKAALHSFDPKGKLFSNDQVDVQTAHSYKGGEADLVILLNVNNGSFPLLHPDNALFGIFDKTLMDAMDEERRLFYVALTRAKEKLFILSEKEDSSIFLKPLSISLPNEADHPWENLDFQTGNSPSIAGDELDLRYEIKEFEDNY